MISVFFVSSVFERAHEVLPGSPPTGAFAKELMRCESSLYTDLKSECGCNAVANYSLFILHSSLNYLETKKTWEYVSPCLPPCSGLSIAPR